MLKTQPLTKHTFQFLMENGPSNRGALFTCCPSGVR